ncbi:MAG: von Willebrand factor type A domain-containing protein, partial [Nitrospinae bacterium]|nr:von Willebrand factor type A domain-containing protein [Nitrospinota bacterium]
MNMRRWLAGMGIVALLAGGCVTDGGKGSVDAGPPLARESVQAGKSAPYPPTVVPMAAASPSESRWRPPLENPNDQPYDAMFFTHYGVNPTVDTDEEPLSTFAVDVDTASYSMARAYLTGGNLPPADAVRVEEFVNAFPTDDPAPATGDFAVATTLFPSPSRPGYALLRIGIRGRDVADADRKPSNLVFVVDTSGSMERDDRLGLVKQGLGYLVDRLKDDDTVALVTYGDSAVLALPPTPGREKSAILAALFALRPTGVTNAQAGIHLGYETAAKAFRKGAINRIVLCSDGVANNGIATGADTIFATVKDKAALGITLSAVGFGMGNYNDTLMERLADDGDGNYAYVDRPAEARRVFAQNLTGMLQVIAKDVKVQVAFDPKRVSRYRLLGYENRRLEKE